MGKTCHLLVIMVVHWCSSVHRFQVFLVDCSDSVVWEHCCVMNLHLHLAQVRWQSQLHIESYQPSVIYQNFSIFTWKHLPWRIGRCIIHHPISQGAPWFRRGAQSKLLAPLGNCRACGWSSPMWSGRWKQYVAIKSETQKHKPPRQRIEKNRLAEDDYY